MRRANCGDGVELTRACSANNTNSLVHLSSKSQPLQNRRQTLGISDFQILDLNLALLWPTGTDVLPVLVLNLQIAVLENTFSGIHIQLKLSRNANSPTNRVTKAQRKRKSESSQTGINTTSGNDERGNSSGKQGSRDTNANNKPAAEECIVPGASSKSVNEGEHSVPKFRRLGERSNS